MNTAPVRFTHVNKPRLRYSVAYSFTKNPDNTLNVTYGISQCRRGDTFSRKDGRTRAEARLRKAATGKDSLHYGNLTLRDAEGLSVGRAVSEAFEDNRKLVLSHLNNVNQLEVERAQAFLRQLGMV